MKLLINPNTTLLSDCKKGKRRAQRELYDLYKVHLHKICLGYSSDRTMAQDMLQEGFIRIFKNLHSFNGSGSFAGWARRVTVNACIDYIKKNKSSELLYTSLDDGNESHSDFAESDTFNALALSDFQVVISQLPLGYKTVLNLHFVEGYTHKEIGEKLGVSPGTSKSQLAKAKNKLMSNLDHYFDSESLELYAGRRS